MKELFPIIVLSIIAGFSAGVISAFMKLPAWVGALAGAGLFIALYYFFRSFPL